MPPANPRKRAAPESSPQMTQAFPAASQMSNAEFLRWNQGGDNTSYPEPSYDIDMNTFGGNGVAQQSYDQSTPIQSTQLARRPMNRQQLVQAGQRYDNTTDPWGQFGDESMLDTQNGNTPLEENDNIELLEERAAVAKRDAQSKRKQIPPFVQKLSSFLDESKNTELIRWSDRGDSFVVLDEDEFAKTLIPELFKHNNYASFVRQLNMYGFHKRVGLSDNSMKASERKNKSPSEYYNPYFKRGHPNLLWLINKPKGGATKGKAKGRVKNEDGMERDSDDDGQEIEEVYGNNVQNPRALSVVPESGPLQRRDVAVLQHQLTEVQKQQAAITNAISRLRKDHNQLYQQSMAFQSLHDRHENSINAILTFLATVYNRSLDTQNPQGFSQLFANGVSHDAQQGNVVDMGEMKPQREQSPGNLSPHRRTQRLLMAPPQGGGRATTVSPAASGPAAMPSQQEYATPETIPIEEVFDSPGDTIHAKGEPVQPAQQSMMNIIHNTNAQARPNSSNMQFPEMLSHYENANGNSPLTSEQRNSMLNLMANTSSAPGSNNALVSPTPPLPPSLEDLNYTQAELDELVKLQHDQEHRLNNLKSQIEPLSPSGSIPGLGDAYFNGTDGVDTNAANIDLDQFLDSGAFYNGSSPLGGGGQGDYGYDAFGDINTGLGQDSHFDLGMDGADDRTDSGGGRVVEAGSSGTGTPDDGTGGVNFGKQQQQNQQQQQDEESMSRGLRSPSKRRRRN